MVLNLDNDKLTRENEASQTEASSERGGGSLTMSRLNFFRLGLLGGFSLLGWRMWDLQKPLEDNSARIQQTTTKLTPDTRYIIEKPRRGIIYDRNGKLLVNNQALYSVTITANDLPDPSKALTKSERQALVQQRQEVYDNLARFLGMKYFIGIVPEQVNGLKKKGAFTNKERNAILNELEILTGISAQDWDKRLTRLSEEERDKTMLVINEETPIPIDQFDRYTYLRDRFDTDIFFMSEAERKMREAQFYVPAFEPVEVWPNISRQDAMWLSEKKLEFPGIGIQTNYIRQYEDPRLFCHILGYTGRFQSQEQLVKANKDANGENFDASSPDDPGNRISVYTINDKIGRTGVEAWMEPFLRGRKGATEVKVNSTGNILEVTATGKAAQPGHNVTLTIDWQLQELVARTLDKWINEANQKKNAKVKEGAAVVMDVKTGEVLALVAFPFYNNNLYNKPGKEWTPAEIEELSDQEKAVEVNRAVQARYAPGSTFKLITAAAALNERKINRGTEFDCTKNINIPTTLAPTPSSPYRCWERHGRLNVVGAIENSCDIFFYNAAVAAETNKYYGQNRYYNRGNTTNPIIFNGTGIDPLNGYMTLFNLGKRTGIELPYEYPGSLPGPHTKLWSIGETMTTAIGQGDVEMTPLQMTMITAAIANGGKLWQPRLVRTVTDLNGKEVLPFEPKLIRDVTKDPIKWSYIDTRADGQAERKTEEFVLAPAVLQVIREGMLAVTGVRGTANKAMYNQMGRLKVAGKTGTAEYGEVLYTDKENGYDVRATRAWFTAYAPFDDPKVAVTVLIPSSEAVIEGSTFAVPAVKEILEYIFPDLVKAKP